MASRRKRRGRGGQLLLLLALLALLGGAGTWNYRRNVAAENAEVRPYRSLSDADLAALTAAAEAEAEAAEQRYRRARSAPPAAAETNPTGGRYDAFERAQRRGRAVRELGHAVSEHDAMLGALRRERERRAGQGDETQVLLRRVFGSAGP